MSTAELLATVKAAGIVLTATGDRLTYDAPKGRMTPDLRAQIIASKAELLRLLAPSPEFVCLRGGLTLPLPALLLALDLESRGFKMSVDEAHQFQIERTPLLTDEDRAGISRWRLHMGAILEYDAHEHTQ